MNTFSSAAQVTVDGATRNTITRGYAARALSATATLCFCVMVTGQFIFAFYIAAFYGGAAMAGEWQQWNAVMPHGLEFGGGIASIFSNSVVASHLMIAFIITVCGPLQLVSGVRKYAPLFHRWNGRVYLVTAVIMGVGGLYLGNSNRELIGDSSQHFAASANAVFIIIFAVMALFQALKRNFPSHSRWAVRLFLAVSGVWFFRVGFMFWVIVNQGPKGFDPETFTGPALTFISFSQFLLPLLIYELYWRARVSTLAIPKWTMSGILALSTAAIGIGVFAATAGMWLPRLT